MSKNHFFFVTLIQRSYNWKITEILKFFTGALLKRTARYLKGFYGANISFIVRGAIGFRRGVRHARTALSGIYSHVTYAVATSTPRTDRLKSASTRKHSMSRSKYGACKRNSYRISFSRRSESHRSSAPLAEIAATGYWVGGGGRGKEVGVNLR